MFILQTSQFFFQIATGHTSERIAVYDAINARETATRSSVIIVDEKEDHGEIITQGPFVEVWQEIFELDREDILRNYSRIHQEIQKQRSDWPSLTTALRMISEGRVALGTKLSQFDEWRTVYIDNQPLAYHGFRIK